MNQVCRFVATAADYYNLTITIVSLYAVTNLVFTVIYAPTFEARNGIVCPTHIGKLPYNFSAVCIFFILCAAQLSIFIRFQNRKWYRCFVVCFLVEQAFYRILEVYLKIQLYLNLNGKLVYVVPAFLFIYAQQVFFMCIFHYFVVTLFRIKTSLAVLLNVCETSWTGCLLFCYCTGQEAFFYFSGVFTVISSLVLNIYCEDSIAKQIMNIKHLVAVFLFVQQAFAFRCKYDYYQVLCFNISVCILLVGLAMNRRIKALISRNGKSAEVDFLLRAARQSAKLTCIELSSTKLNSFIITCCKLRYLGTYKGNIDPFFYQATSILNYKEYALHDYYDTYQINEHVKRCVNLATSLRESIQDYVPDSLAKASELDALLTKEVQSMLIRYPYSLATYWICEWLVQHVYKQSQRSLLNLSENYKFFDLSRSYELFGHTNSTSGVVQQPVLLEDYIYYVTQIPKSIKRYYRQNIKIVFSSNIHKIYKNHHKGVGQILCAIVLVAFFAFVVAVFGIALVGDSYVYAKQYTPEYSLSELAHDVYYLNTAQSCYELLSRCLYLVEESGSSFLRNTVEKDRFKVRIDNPHYLKFIAGYGGHFYASEDMAISVYFLADIIEEQQIRGKYDIEAIQDLFQYNIGLSSQNSFRKQLAEDIRAIDVLTGGMLCLAFGCFLALVITLLRGLLVIGQLTKLAYLPRFMLQQAQIKTKQRVDAVFGAEHKKDQVKMMVCDGLCLFILAVCSCYTIARVNRKFHAKDASELLDSSTNYVKNLYDYMLELDKIDFLALDNNAIEEKMREHYLQMMKHLHTDVASELQLSLQYALSMQYNFSADAATRIIESRGNPTVSAHIPQYEMRYGYHVWAAIYRKQFCMRVYLGDLNDTNYRQPFATLFSRVSDYMQHYVVTNAGVQTRKQQETWFLIVLYFQWIALCVALLLTDRKMIQILLTAGIFGIACVILGYEIILGCWFSRQVIEQQADSVAAYYKLLNYLYWTSKYDGVRRTYLHKDNFNGSEYVSDEAWKLMNCYIYQDLEAAGALNELGYYLEDHCGRTDIEMVAEHLLADVAALSSSVSAFQLGKTVFQHVDASQLCIFVFVTVLLALQTLAVCKQYHVKQIVVTDSFLRSQIRRFVLHGAVELCGAIVFIVVIIVYRINYHAHIESGAYRAELCMQLRELEHFNRIQLTKENAFLLKNHLQINTENPNFALLGLETRKSLEAVNAYLRDAQSGDTLNFTGLQAGVVEIATECSEVANSRQLQRFSSLLYVLSAVTIALVIYNVALQFAREERIFQHYISVLEIINQLNVSNLPLKSQIYNLSLQYLQ